METNEHNYYLGVSLQDINRLGGNIPGFNMLKDKVIKPLIFATEKVVEYYLQEETNQITQNRSGIANLTEPQTEVNSKDDNLSIGTAFNLQRKFERLHISRESLSTSQVNSSEIPSFSGLGKRTYRELEKWDIDDEPRNDCSKSAANFLDRASIDQISN